MLKMGGPLLFALLATGCGDDGGKGTNKDAATDSKVAIDATPTDAAIDASMVDAAPGTFPLTVKNYLAWCDVSINGATASAASVQTVNLLPGTYTLVGRAANSTFQIGPNMWHHTTGDSGAGETGGVAGSGVTATSTVMVTVGSAAKCAWVCCPFSPGGNGCEANVVGELCP